MTLWPRDPFCTNPHKGSGGFRGPLTFGFWVMAVSSYPNPVPLIYQSFLSEPGICPCNIQSALGAFKVTQHAALLVIWVIFFQNELMVELYSESLVRAIGGKVLLMKFGKNTNKKTIKVMKNGLCL